MPTLADKCRRVHTHDVSSHSPKDRAFYKIWGQVKREEPNCWLCHQPIDPALKKPDPMGFTVDHIIPVSKAPWLARVRSNMRGAHMRCNSRRGTGTGVVGNINNYSGTDL
jgi:5-methylcytosine-specific restriction endonuclease McrA